MKPPIRESTVEKKIKEYAERCGCLCYKFSSPGNTSVPDRIICYQGRVLFLELKRPGARPTLKQFHTINKMQEHGLLATWTDSVDGGKQIISDFIDQKLTLSPIC